MKDVSLSRASPAYASAEDKKIVLAEKADTVKVKREDTKLATWLIKAVWVKEKMLLTTGCRNYREEWNEAKIVRR